MLPPYLRAYQRSFEHVSQNAQGLLLGLSDEQFNWNLMPSTWSIAQCFAHLMQASEALLPNVEKALRHGKTYGPFGSGPFSYGPLNRVFIWSVKPSSPPLPAPGSYRPSDEPRSRDTILRGFLQQQERWQQAVEASEGLDLRKIKVASSAAPLARLSLGAWFEATPLHQLRHLEQVQRVMLRAGFLTPAHQSSKVNVSSS